MLSVGTVVMGVGDLHRAADFWMKALSYVPKRAIDAGDDFAILVPADGTGAHLALDVSKTPVQSYPRVHLDLYAGDAADQASEVDRLVALGAAARRLGPVPRRPRLRGARRHRAQPVLRHRHESRLTVRMTSEVRRPSRARWGACE